MKGIKSKQAMAKERRECEEDFIGNQGLERIMAGVGKKTGVSAPLNWLVSYKFYEGTITDCNVKIKDVA